jgi:hypothetical protein
MRKIDKDYAAIPSGLTGALYTQKLAQSLVEQGVHRFSTSVYRHPSVLKDLLNLYNNKCAFCESDTSAGAPLQVEHFRPKAKVELFSPPHPGYYWLGYQWSNLLLACSSCNNKKRNFFPISGIRLVTHPVTNGALDLARCLADGAELMGEQPTLINPEIELDPMFHFEFYPDGTIKGNTDPGRETIIVCGLNRPPLIIKRKEFYDHYLERFNQYFIDYRENEDMAVLILQLKNAIKEMVNHIAKNKPYTEFASKCLTNFKTFYVDRFQPEEAKPLIQAYNLVVN